MIELLKDLVATFREGKGPVPEPALERLCAALMLQLAAIDQNLDAAEETVIQEYIRRHFGLTEEETRRTLEDARADAERATSLYELTSVINSRCDEDQKVYLIYQMWCLAFADGTLDRYEEHFIRRAAELLYVPHVRMMRAKHDAAQDTGFGH